MLAKLLRLCVFFIFSYAYTENYSVKPNDSLWIIAKNNKIAISDIRKLNDLNNDKVYVGQKLYIPTSITNYTIKSEDTYKSIANQFGIELKYIVTLNNISENYAIEGQSIRIPIVKNPIIKNLTLTPNKTIKTTPIVYKVARGDTLSDIALKYKTSIPKLKQLNNKNSSYIYIGEKLIVGNRVIPSQGSTSNIQNKKKIIHTVKHGDTLGQIAINYNISSHDILTWNNKKNATIYNQEKLTLYIPEKSTKIQKNNSYKHITYIVKKGENLSHIAAKFQTTSSIIKKINKKQSDSILIGETLHIPVKITEELEHSTLNKKEDTKLIRYKVKRGDTLDNIAYKYKIKRSDLLSWNNKRSTRIYIGEDLKLYIPMKNNTLAKKTSKKAEYIKKNSITGINSSKFKNIPLPIKTSQILSTTSSGRGIDVTLKQKENIQAPIDSIVQYAGYINALQNVVILKLPQDRTIVYAGMDRLNVTTGQKISQGYLLGSTGIHQIDKQPKLYIEMRDQNKVINILNSYKELSKTYKK